MAVTPVTLGPVLRAWSMAGMTHILCDGPVDPVYLGHEGALQARPAAQEPRGAAPARVSAPSPQQREGAPPQRPTQPAPPDLGSGRAAPAGGGTARPAVPVPAASPFARSAPAGATPASPASAPEAPAPLAFAPRQQATENPADWPDAWKGWFARITPAPVLWTYHELGADLTGIGRSPERSAFFKNLIGELGLPKGSSVFWPSAMPLAEEGAEAGKDAEPRANPAVFASGLARLGPQIVVVFGEAALADMGLAGRIRYFRQEMVEGKLLLCLPEIDALLRNQAQRASAVSLLRAVLASVVF